MLDYIVIFESTPEHVTICMEDCGTSLRTALKQKQLSLPQVLSVCYQVMLGLAVAEALYEYEHRDLHLHNIMVRRTTSPYLGFLVRSRSHRVATHGMRAFIIDNTFARARVGGQHYFTHLSGKLTKLAQAYLDKRDTLTEQDRVYVRMFQTAKHDWAQWMPQSNLYWMRHIALASLKAAPFYTEDEDPYHRELVKLADHFTCGSSLQSVLRRLTSDHKKVTRVEQQ